MSDPMIGRKFGDYRIEERIKQAGFSTVYRARNVKLGKDVAIKLISAEVASNGALMRQVRKEARIYRRLDHINIVKGLGFCNARPRPYTIMEYFPSRDLKSLVLNELDEVKRHVREIAVAMSRAVAFLHEKGMIHCDIKSNNILVSSDWKVKIVDFALARSAAWTWIPLFRKREGTLEYLSPEQVRRKRMTKQTDVYAIGATIYEMIAGRPPHVGHDPKQVMESILHLDPTPLREMDREITPRFDSLVSEMLAKERKNRPSDAGVVLARLTTVSIFTEKTDRGI